jgi:hypothetical protein
LTCDECAPRNVKTLILWSTRINISHLTTSPLELEQLKIGSRDHCDHSLLARLPLIRRARCTNLPLPSHLLLLYHTFLLHPALIRFHHSTTPAIMPKETKSRKAKKETTGKRKKGKLNSFTPYRSRTNPVRPERTKAWPFGLYVLRQRPTRQSSRGQSRHQIRLVMCCCPS